MNVLIAHDGVYDMQKRHDRYEEDATFILITQTSHGVTDHKVYGGLQDGINGL